MSTTIFGLTAKSIKAELNGDLAEVRLARFVCMDNGFFETKKRETLINKAKASFAKSRPAEYLVDDSSNLDPPFVGGHVVFRVPENYGGVHSCYESEKFEIVGTMIQHRAGDGKYRYVIETDVREVEKLRREKEFQGMKAGRTFIGLFGTDVDAYKKTLAVRDQENPSGMATRGHGIS